MDDPMDRDLFPDRPDHPDFWRLVEICNQHDGQSEEDERLVDDILAEMIDPDSIAYFTTNRAGTYLQKTGMPLGLVSVIAAAMMDGIITGIKFEQRGGRS